MPIARWGISTLLIAAALMAWAVWLCPSGPVRWGAGAAALVVYAWLVFFFRNPPRRFDGPPGCLLAPSDGVVVDIEEVTPSGWIDEPCLRIGIFMSIFNVHVNRSPAAGVVAYAHYRPGRFIDARRPTSKHENEANTLGIAVDDAVAPGLKVLVRQISGLIARRIVCTHAVGDRLERGEVFGMVRLGSRTELWVPAAYPHRVAVAVGDAVRCGESVLVTVGEVDDA